jgi:hypothetical protein
LIALLICHKDSDSAAVNGSTIIEKPSRAIRQKILRGLDDILRFSISSVGAGFIPPGNQPSQALA